MKKYNIAFTACQYKQNSQDWEIGDVHWIIGFCIIPLRIELVHAGAKSDAFVSKEQEKMNIEHHE